MVRAKKISHSNSALEAKFQRTAFRLNQERSDFLLPQIIDFVTSKRWINLSPEYQRRLVWDVNKRSMFIESLLLNIPVPSLFLYENELNRYEVMDGQQRLNAVVDFLTNKYELKGLEKWSELNGLRFDDLPEILRRGLERRRLSATVLLVEKGLDSDLPENNIRKLVFERLNTGGQELNAQELRNCLYSGNFNDMLVSAARGPEFTEAWDIPAYAKNVDKFGKVSTALAENKLYRRMGDCEIVLRFFAFREKSKIKGSVRAMLDDCMERNAVLTEPDVRQLEQCFAERVKFCRQLFGTRVFRYKDQKDGLRLSQPLYDAQMIAVDRLWSHRSRILAAKRSVEKAITRLLSKPESFEVMIGRPNTATAVKERLDLLESILRKAAGLS